VRSKKVIIIGGGFAGLSAGAFLSDAGFNVEILEASPKLGGRAYSFVDDDSNSVIDNGQHILMGCYKDTLRFLKLIGAEDNLIFQDKLKVIFLKQGFELFTLRAFPLPYPFNLLFGLLNYQAISFNERLKLLKFFLMIHFYTDKELGKLTVRKWLEKEGQNEQIRKAFWDFIAIGALNTSIEKASAKIFSDVLKKIFFRGNKATTIILPRYGLTETYCNDAVKFIEAKGGKVNLSEQVLEIKVKNNLAGEIVTSKRIIKDFDFVISSVPLFALKKILEDEIISPQFDFTYSSILTVHIWLKENTLKEDFYGLIDSPIHWVFNHGNHITLVRSDADEIIDKTKEELFDDAACELKKYLHIDRDNIKSYKILKEKRATYISFNDILNKRPSQKTKVKNLFLAGDWVETGLPSTIESAVKSGRMAAEEIF
jgi:squalene-associated FAD-dependent desaturase